MSRDMKDSGVQWIGKIPKEWDIKTIKSILAERKETNNPVQTDFILSLTNDRGVIPYNKKGAIGNKSKEDITKYKLAYPNDIVLNSMNVIIGSVGLSKYYGAVSPVYYMLNVRDANDSIEYFNDVFQTREFQNNLRGYGNGIMEIRMRIQMSKLNTVLLPYPPKEEQKKISEFLKVKVAHINRIISDATAIIEEYKIYKKSLITEAVTKGLDLSMRMKESEVEYIGEIPVTWSTRKIKYVLTPLERPVQKTDDVITCFRDGEVTLRKNRREDGYTFSDTEKGYQGVEVGDLVVHGMDAFAGAIGISDSRGKCTPVVHVCDSKEHKRFYVYFLRALAFNDVFMALSDGVRIRSSDFRNWSKLSKIVVAVPPIREQQQIADFLDKKCIEIENLITQKQQLIRELQIYKKTLTYECVTGKREVF
ncbi:restriction endonuclease subunit S [Bacillus cereus]|uniref:Restriction endonuclease subunit S n=1 Tax=Bacillus cereus TaxID=1396 RepID=A0A2B0MG90_BACCE|nr:restriction endonuclease subunit S [Bacillus cereus]